MSGSRAAESDGTPRSLKRATTAVPAAIPISTTLTWLSGAYLLPSSIRMRRAIDVLLCSSNDWVAALGHVPRSCTDRKDVLAHGTHGTS